MKLIPLTQGKFAMVDDEDYEYLSQFKWQATKSRNTFYATRKTGAKPRQGFSMHREILSSGKITDHKDGNGLNNQRSNLRNATLAQNCQNAARSSSKIPFKGVDFPIRKDGRKWWTRYRATIDVEKRRIHLGYFKNPISAAMAYDAAALKYHGDFARTNFPKESTL